MPLGIANGRTGPHRDTHILRWLDEEVSTAFKRYFGRHGDVSLEMEQEVLAVFDDPVEGKNFLACDCQGALERLPMTTAVIQERDPNGGHVRVMDRRPAHAEDCPLARKGESRPNRVRPPTAPPPENVPFAALRPFRGRLQPGARAAVRVPLGDGFPRVPRPRGASLATLMMLLCEWAGLNRIQHGEPRPRKAERLRSVLENARGEICPGQPLRDWLAVRPRVPGHEGAHTHRVALSLALRNPAGWPPECRPQGYFFDSFAGLDGQVAFDEGFRLEIKHRPSLFHYPEGQTTDGPLLGMVVISQLRRGEPWTDPVLGYFHPCYSHATLFPVDSRQESATLDVLCRLQSNPYLPAFHIWKPLFDLPVPGSDATARPDFILSLHDHPERRILVETMGMHTADYEPDKERQHRVMQPLGAWLLQHERREQGEGRLAQADGAFAAEVKRALQQLA